MINPLDITGIKEYSRKTALAREPFVSVVINFYNEKDNVDMAPACLCRQTYRNFEVILVDDGSTDDTGEILVQKYKNVLNFKLLVNQRNEGIRPARLKGVKAARGDIIITLDMHTIFGNNFIEKIVSIFSNDPEVAIVSPLVVSFGDRFFQKGLNVIYKVSFKLRRIMKKYSYAFGGAAAYRRQALYQIGLLRADEVVEDVDASWRLAKLGWRIHLDDSIMVFHKEPDKLLVLIRKMIAGGINTCYLIFEHPEKIFYPQSLVRIFGMPIMLLLLFTLNPKLSVVLLGTAVILWIIAVKLWSKEGFLDTIYSLIMLSLILALHCLGFWYAMIKKCF